MKIFEIKNYDNWHANSYVLYDKDSCILIDPCHINDDIENFINANNLAVKALILTHAHFDHITGVDYFINKYHCDFLMHWNDRELLKDTYKNCSWMVNEEITCDSIPSDYLEDNQILNILSEEIKVIHTPYHTKGGICLFCPTSKILISGDSMFKGGTGRTDLPTGSNLSMIRSLMKLKKLPKDTIVYPGHGENTTIGDELF